MSKVTVISYGAKKRGTKTAQIIVKPANGQPRTVHVQKIGNVWADKQGVSYELPS